MMKLNCRIKKMWLVAAALFCAGTAWAESDVLPSGTYYMKNVASGKFLTGGNAWGTQASLSGHAEDVDLILLENGTYQIDSKLSNGGDNHYLSSGGWMDSAAEPWAFIKQSDGIYALTVDSVNYLGWDGTATTVAAVNLSDPTSPNAQWEVITKEELIETLANATALNPVDATFFIQDPNFGRNNTRFSVWQGSPIKGGSNENYCAEKWNCSFDVFQDLSALPNGYYQLTAQGFYRAGNGGTTDLAQLAYFYANDVTTPVVNILSEAGNAAITGNTSDVEGYGHVPNNMTSASDAFTAGLYAGHSLMVEVTDGTLRIGVKKDSLITSDWTIFDNFELTYYGTEQPTEGDVAIAPFIETLAALLEEAIVWKGELDGSDEMHAQVIATLEQMIPAVQAVLDNPESKEAVEQMIGDVKAMLETYMPMIEQYDAKVLATLAIEGARELMASYSDYTDNAGLAKAIATVQTVLDDLNMGWATTEDLSAALASLTTAQEAFLVENTQTGSGDVVFVDGVRQKPTLPATLSAVPTDGTFIYMYNVGAQKFFCGGNAWGAQTSVDDEGYKVCFEQYVVDGAWDGTTVYFRDSVETKKQIRDVFFDNFGGQCFVDRGSQPNYFWKLEKNADNDYYRLSMAEVNPEYQSWQVETHPGTYFGWDEANGTVVSAFLNPNVEGVHVDWAFVTVEGYHSFVASVELYNAAQALKVSIDKAKVLGISVSTQQVVYLNPSATLADIEKATNEVGTLLAKWEEGNVNPYTPVDKTSEIVNPSYDENKNDGWSGTTPGFQSYDNAEHYNKIFDTYQDLTNVPNGLYKLSVQGYYRPSGYSYEGYLNGELQNAVFYANNGVDNFTVPVPDIFAGASEEPLEGASNHQSGIWYLPNSMQAASAYFKDGRYETELFVNVNNGALRIGVALSQLAGSMDWTIWDNWRLTYYGNSDDAYSIVLDSLADRASYKFDGRESEMTVGLLDTYRETLNGLTATDLATFNAGRAAIDEAIAAVQTNIDGWVKYEEEMARGTTIANDKSFSPSTQMTTMAVYVRRQAPAILRKKEHSTEELLAEVAKLTQLIEDAIRGSLEENSDVTDKFLVNPKFEDTSDGRSDGRGWEGNWTDVNGPSDNKAMEIYAGWSTVEKPNVEIYQVVKDAPQGVYEISLNGFCRVGDFSTDSYQAYLDAVYFGQTVETHASVFVNNNKTPFKNVYDESVNCGELYSAKEVYGPTPWLPNDDSTGLWFPNGMYDAGVAFANGLYKSAAHGVVAREGDELRIGVVCKNLTLREWVIFDNFQMIFRGKQIEYVMPHLQEAIAAANETLNQPMAVDTKALLEAAKANAEAMLNSTDEDAVFDALVQIYAANDSVEASADLFAELRTKADNLQNAIMMYEATATEDVMNAATELLIRMFEAMEGSSTKEEVQDMIAQVEPVINALIMGDYTNANDENPVDITGLIKSASFEDINGYGSAEGWTGANGATGSGAYEFWQKSFDLYQELNGLPNGTYRLEVSAFERIGSVVEDYESYISGMDTATTYFYGQSGDAYYQAPVKRLASGAITSYDAFIDGMTEIGYTDTGETVWVANTMYSAVVMFNDYAEYQNVMYVQVTDGTLRIGMKKDFWATNDWVMMDNWRLYYHGTNSQFAPGYTPSDKEYSTDNTFSINDTEVMKGNAFELPVYMTNADGISAFQCDIYLSSGLQMNYNDEGDYAITLNSSRATSSHTLASELQADGAIRVIVYSNGSKLFRGNSGELFTIGLTASSTRNQSVEIRNIHLSTANEVEYLTADVAANITVKTYTPADVNGDGTVSIVDVVAVVNNLLGTTSGNFIFDAADMDHNGEITIVDVVAVVNALLGKDVQAYGARSVLRSNLHVADADINAGETTTLYVQLDNAQAYTAMQMDVELPEGLSIEGVEMIGNASHAVAYSEEGRIAAYSLTNRTFNGGESLMAITVKADESFTGSANIDFTNVRVVSKDVVENTLADAFSTITGGAYGIDAVEADKAQVLYYSTTGEVSDQPFQGLNIIKRIYKDGRVEVTKEMK